MKTKRTNHKFTAQEDAKLRKLVREYGTCSWEEVASHMEGRNQRQCHDRWIYYLSPSINNSPWTDEEDERLLSLCKELNYKWVKISKHFKGRNDTQIKNRWNILKKERNLPDIPKRRKAEEKKVDHPQTIPDNFSNIDFSNIFNKIDSLFSIVGDNNVGDYSNDFFM